MRKVRQYLNIFSTVAVAVCVLCLILQTAFTLSPQFADSFNISVGRIMRFILAKITAFLPFSLGELVLLSSPVLITAVCLIAASSAKKSRLCAFRAVISTVLAAALVWCVFVLDFSSGYHGTPLSDKLSLKDDPVSAEELYYTTNIMVESLNELCEDAVYLHDGSSIMPFSLNELSEKLCISYECVSETYSFIDRHNTKVKPLVISPIMTYTHISGVYSFFTGEANLNTNFPDYICTYTAAHEMAHQRGISREDEANFVAFLVCKESDNAYIRYSGYLNMYEYLSDALYKADPNLYEKAYKSLSPKVRGELAAYSKFFDKYRYNVAATVSDTVNNAYLESQGTVGVASYGMVVDLAVAYYRNAD